MPDSFRVEVPGADASKSDSSRSRSHDAESAVSGTRGEVCVVLT